MNTMREQLRAAMDRASDEYEAKLDQLTAKVKQADDAKIVADARLGELDGRERAVANRENALGELRSVASNRLGVIKTLEEQVRIARDQCATAKAETRVAREEQARLETLIAKLIADKKELLREIENTTGATLGFPMDSGADTQGTPVELAEPVLVG